MQVTFKPCHDLVRVGDVGESIVEADDSFRRQFSILVLVAARKREIPLRNKNGFKIPQESLDITESQTRDSAKRHVEQKLLPPGGDFAADLQRAQGLLSAQPWIKQHCDIDAKLQAYAKDFEKHKEFIESVVQSETRRLLDDWYRDASVLVSEVAEWFCKTHDFEVHIAAPSNPNDEQSRTVSDATTFGYNQLLAICNVQDEDDFGGYVVKKTGIYVKNHKKHHKQAWSLLTPSERAVLAWRPTGDYDKPALPIPCTLGQLRFFVVEAGLAGCIDENAVSQFLTSVVKSGEATLLSSTEEDAAPDRFARRHVEDGFNNVKREKAGERNLEAKVAAVTLTDERCFELAQSQELRIADWTALTGIGIGVHWSHRVTTEGVAFRNWTEKEIREASVDQQIEMHRDNEAMPLKFPCAPSRLMQFIDAAPPGSHIFSIPDAFRQAVAESEQTTGTLPSKLAALLEQPKSIDVGTTAKAASLPISNEKFQLATVTTNRLSGRENVLDPVISLARSEASDSNSTQAVWATLVEIAWSENRPAPLLGYADTEGVKYRRDSDEHGVGIFTKKNLADRMRRMRAKTR